MKRSTKRVRVKVHRRVRVKRKNTQHSARPNLKPALPAPPPPPRLSASGQTQPHSRKRRLPPPPPRHRHHHQHHPNDPDTHLHHATPYHRHLPHLPKPPSTQERKVHKVPSANEGSNDGSSEWKGTCQKHVRTCPKPIPRCQLRCSKVFGKQCHWSLVFFVICAFAFPHFTLHSGWRGQWHCLTPPAQTLMTVTIRYLP